jgi:hypothetical protein
MRMFRGWFQYSEWLQCFTSILPKNRVLLCVFCGQNDEMQRILIKKCFLFTERSVCRVKRFTTGSNNFLKDVRKSKMMPDWVRKWLRQQAKDFYAAGFNALVKRWTRVWMLVKDLSINKCFFFSVSNITCFTLYINWWHIYWLSLIFSSKPEGSAEDLFSSLQLRWGETMYLSILLHWLIIRYTHTRAIQSSVHLHRLLLNYRIIRAFV